MFVFQSHKTLHVEDATRTQHLPKHKVLSPNEKFCQRIWYVEHFFVHCSMCEVKYFASQKFCLTLAKIVDSGQSPLWLRYHLWCVTVFVLARNLTINAVRKLGIHALTMRMFA